ncbi:MAG: nitrate reductase cytochrome c-type subunit [Thiobacillaceae bacterium]
MKKHWTVTIVLALLGGTTTLYAGSPTIHDDSMGLSKTSVFDNPAPPVFAYSDKAPNKSGVLPRAYPGAPPQIPHSIDGFVPIKADENSCLDCHDKPALMGKKIKGMATAMPASHYTNVDGKWQRNNNRYVCTQCHVPQANVKELVGNSFKTQ